MSRPSGPRKGEAGGVQKEEACGGQPLFLNAGLGKIEEIMICFSCQERQKRVITAVRLAFLCLIPLQELLWRTGM